MTNKKLLVWLFIFIVSAVIGVSGAIYNTTNITSANSLYDQTKALNDIVGHIIGVAFLLVVSIITFMVILGYGDVLAALNGAGFIAALSGSILLVLGFIPFYMYQVVILLFGASVVASLIIRRA